VSAWYARIDAGADSADGADGLLGILPFRARAPGRPTRASCAGGRGAPDGHSTGCCRERKQ
jgi:hypothetical protein